MSVGRGSGKALFALAAVFAAAVLWARPAPAAYVSTADLGKLCQSNDKADINACVYYVAGVIDYHILLQSLGTAPPTLGFCLPDSLTMPQAAALVVAYLQTSAPQDGFVAASSIPLALNKVFPCAPAVPRKKK